MSTKNEEGPESKIEPVSEFLNALQEEICSTLESIDKTSRFGSDEWAREGGGLSRPRVLEEGAVIEKAAVNFTQTSGQNMPAAATKRRPELSGATYKAASISVIVHPRNPYAPTSHANFRFFLATPDQTQENKGSIWWFGGGFDLTPYYGFQEDAVYWHQTARNACSTFGPEIYPKFKKACDDYFYLPHRDEPRGIGGLFFDDFDKGGFSRAFDLVRRLGQAYSEAYIPILEKRKDTPYGDRERNFQLYRRGRYVEFNLLHDRGTLFGLQAATRVESVLASMPPLVAWKYDWHPAPDTPEATLYEEFLKPREWIPED